MNTIRMEDLVKSGLFVLALMAMITIASFQFTEEGAKITNGLTDNKISKDKKLELLDKEEIDIPL